MDHDFLKGGNHERPFTPPPEQSMLRWFSALLILLALAYAGYRIIERRNHPAPDAAIEQAPKASSQATEQVPKQPPSSTAPEPGTRMVTKCLVNGKTSYRDGECASGATASQIATKENHNLMNAMRVPAPGAVEPSIQPTVVTQEKPDPDYAAMKAECVTLDDRVKYLDAMARQPQSMQMHDWIRNERKLARDRQARIPCR